MSQSINETSLTSIVSTPEEIDEFASELADEYINYLFVDTVDQRNKLENSIEECLAHLEEICSVLDSYRQKSGSFGRFVKTMKSKSDSLETLYKQVDAVDKYTNDTNNLLDTLDDVMKDLERNSNTNRDSVRQIMDMLPRISLGLQRFNVFGNMGGLIEDSRPSYLDDSVEERGPVVPIGEILERVADIGLMLETATTRLEAELGTFTTTPDTSKPATATPESIQVIEQVDGSWQELL